MWMLWRRSYISLKISWQQSNTSRYLASYLSISFSLLKYLSTYLCTFQHILYQFYIAHSPESTPSPSSPTQWARPCFLSLNAKALQMQARFVMNIKLCPLVAVWPAAAPPWRGKQTPHSSGALRHSQKNQSACSTWYSLLPQVHDG